MLESLAEVLGRAVRDEWVACKLEEIQQGEKVPPDHLIEWDGLDERNQEIDRRIGLAVLKKFLEISTMQITQEKRRLALAEMANIANQSGHYD
jgi:hypothetical protein